jgi:hypothetical protein
VISVGPMLLAAWLAPQPFRAGAAGAGCGAASCWPGARRRRCRDARRSCCCRGPVAMLMHLCWSMGFWSRVLPPRPDRGLRGRTWRDRHLHLHLPPPQRGRDHRLGPAAGGPEGGARTHHRRRQRRHGVRAGYRAGAGRHIGGWKSTISMRRARNISVARNAALAASTARYLAFLDDDETAEPGGSGALGERHSKSRGRGRAGPRRSRSIPTGRAGLDAAAAIHATRPVFVRARSAQAIPATS